MMNKHVKIQPNELACFATLFYLSDYMLDHLFICESVCILSFMLLNWTNSPFWLSMLRYGRTVIYGWHYSRLECENDMDILSMPIPPPFYMCTLFNAVLVGYKDKH